MATMTVVSTVMAVLGTNSTAGPDGGGMGPGGVVGVAVGCLSLGALACTLRFTVFFYLFRMSVACATMENYEVLHTRMRKPKAEVQTVQYFSSRGRPGGDIRGRTKPHEVPQGFFICIRSFVT